MHVRRRWLEAKAVQLAARAAGLTLDPFRSAEMQSQLQIEDGGGLTYNKSPSRKRQSRSAVKATDDRRKARRSELLTKPVRAATQIEHDRDVVYDDQTASSGGEDDDPRLGIVPSAPRRDETDTAEDDSVAASDNSEEAVMSSTKRRRLHRTCVVESEEAEASDDPSAGQAVASTSHLRDVRVLLYTLLQYTHSVPLRFHQTFWRSCQGQRSRLAESVPAQLSTLCHLVIPHQRQEILPPHLLPRRWRPNALAEKSPTQARKK